MFVFMLYKVITKSSEFFFPLNGWFIACLNKLIVSISRNVFMNKNAFKTIEEKSFYFWRAFYFLWVNQIASQCPFLE